MAGQDGAVDGRRLRRERGRRAVIDAVIDLALADGAPPSAEAVAAKAGVSQASIFRYFATLDDLRHEAIGRYFERFDDVIAIPSIGEGSPHQRVDRLVTARDAFYSQTAPMARMVRRQGSGVAELTDTLRRLRSTLADQLAQHFAPELGRLSSDERRRRLAVLAALTSFESWDQLRSLGDDDRRAALRDAVADLLDIDPRAPA